MPRSSAPNALSEFRQGIDSLIASNISVVKSLLKDTDESYALHLEAAVTTTIHEILATAFAHPEWAQAWLNGMERSTPSAVVRTVPRVLAALPAERAG